jgi:hypothetical protein
MNKTIIALFTSLILVAKVAAQNKGRVKFELNKHFFGDVLETGGKVYHSFEFTNTGNAPVKITNVITGCGCTTADYTKDEVKPGEKGFVKTGFDPRGRVGPFDRLVTIETNGDPRVVTVNMIGTVIPAKPVGFEQYKYRYGNLAITDNVIVLNKVPHDGYDSAYIVLKNIGNKRIDVLNIERPGNIFIDESKFTISPGYDYYLYFKYYPFKPVEFGPIKQTFKLVTNDDSLAIKIFEIRANVVENFGKLDKKALKKAPKATISTREYNFGDVKYYESPTATITVTNKGKSDLIIRKITRSCTCLTITPENTVIKPGKSTNVKVTMGLVNMAGPDTKNIKLLFNDPINTEVQVDFKINVVP